MPKKKLPAGAGSFCVVTRERSDQPIGWLIAMIQ